MKNDRHWPGAGTERARTVACLPPMLSPNVAQESGNRNMSPAYQWPAFRRILPDVLAFAIGLSSAWILRWDTTDLVWSLWLGSLVLGFVTILSTIGGFAYVGLKAITHPEFPMKYRPAALLIGSAVILMYLGFFSFHFGAFHAVHAGFLSDFFPITGLPSDAFFAAFLNPILLWKTAFRYLPLTYGAFLIPAIIAERRYLFASMIESIKEGRGFVETRKGNVREMIPSGGDRKKTLQDPFTLPYINVIRMHLLIFFFAFCHLLKVESFFVYAVVYFVYFFPWKAFQHDTSPAGVAAA
jgi:hypothetical protein